MRNVNIAERSKYHYIGLIVMQSTLYGITDPILKLAYRTAPVFFVLTIRYTVATAIMFLLWHEDILSELHKVPLSKYIAPSLCMASSFIFSNMALDHTAATNVSFLRSLTALVAPLLMLLFYKKRYSKQELFLQFLMLAGLYLLCAKGGLSRFGIGEVFALISTTMAAGALVFGKETLKILSVKTLSFTQASLSIFICLAMGLWKEAFRIPPVQGNGFILFTAISAAILCTVAGYMLQNTALQHISAKVVGMVQCLYPVMTAAASFVILHERLTVPGLLGCGIIIGCILSVSSMKKQDEN